MLEISLGFIFLILIFFSLLRKSYFLNKESVFVIATCINCINRGDEERIAVFEFYFNEKKYVVEEDYMYECFSINFRYYAQIYPKEPELCEVLYKKPVVDGVIQPIGGWDKIQAIDVSRIGRSTYFGKKR